MNYPTLEITTSIPENGCPVNCVFCPQITLTKNYQNFNKKDKQLKRFLSLDDFKILLNKIPKNIRITFCGFTEPFINPQTTDMIVYAHEQEYSVSIFTTGIGLKVNDLECIKHIPFASGPNGGFTLHLPDNEGYAKHAITSEYFRTLEWLKNNRLYNFNIMCMGTVNSQIKHLFNEAPAYPMWSRAGNLFKESLLNPYLINYKNLWNSIWFREIRTCGCEEGLQHNVLLPNGDVSLCCMDYSLDNILGNLFEKSYQEIIPAKFSCFELCQYCENGVIPK